MSTQSQVSAGPANGRSRPLERWAKAGPVGGGMPADQASALVIGSASRRRVLPLLSRA